MLLGNYKACTLLDFRYDIKSSSIDIFMNIKTDNDNCKFVNKCISNESAIILIALFRGYNEAMDVLVEMNKNSNIKNKEISRFIAFTCFET